MLIHESDKDIKEDKGSKCLTDNEYNLIIKTLYSGYKVKNIETGRILRLKPNPRVAMILQTQATLGLRLQDVLKLKLNTFKDEKIEFKEIKTKEIQYRKIDPEFIHTLKNYAHANKIQDDENLFDIEIRTVNKILKKATDYLEMDNITTHSFRKYFAINCYKESKNDLEYVRNMLNHSNTNITQKYLDLN